MNGATDFDGKMLFKVFWFSFYIAVVVRVDGVAVGTREAVDDSTVETRTDVDKLVDEVYEWSSKVHGDPSKGQHFFNFTVEAWRQLKTDVVNFKTRALLTQTSGERDSTNKEILLQQLNMFLEGWPFAEFQALNAVTFLDGVHLDYAWMVLQTNNPKSSDDVEQLLARYDAFPELIDQQLNLMRMSIERGLTLHVVSFRGNRTHNQVLDQFEELVNVANATEHPFYRPFSNMSWFNDSERNSYRRQGTERIQQKIIPGFQRMLNFLKNEYLPNTRDEFSISSWTNGTELYQVLLKYYLTNNMTPQEVHDIGKREVATILGKMNNVLNKVNFTGTLQEFFVWMKNTSNAKFYGRTSQELLDGYNDILLQ